MFYDPSSFSEHKISMDHYREWANATASSYLSSGEDPTDRLCKIAQQESLVPHQIHTLAAEINKSLHQRKYASAENKYHAADFPLADAREAVNRVQLDGGQTKLAVEMKPPVFEDNSPDMYEMFGVKPEEMDKTASIRHELKGALEKTALLREKLADKMRVGGIEADTLEFRFIKTARQHVLANSMNPPERLEKLSELHQFAEASGMMETAREPLAKLAYVLGKEGLLEKKAASELFSYWMTKEADQVAPEFLISDKLPGRIVNGQNPLYITLKTLEDKRCELKLHEDRYKIVDDKAKILAQKARAL